MCKLTPKEVAVESPELSPLLVLQASNTYFLFRAKQRDGMIIVTVVPTKSDSDVMFCLQLLSKTLTCTLHLS